MRGDAVIYLWDETDVDGAIGYHFQNNRGIPFGFVFTSIAEEIGEPWSATLSHEALELIGDPETNLLVIGPHPDPAQDREVFHWFEMCDAVQAETYEIDGIKVSNFVLPLYFTGTRETDEPGARNDYLGRAYRGQTLRSFGINPGGYIGFFDPELGKHDTYSLQGDAMAKERYEVKLQGKETRRAIRYGSSDVRAKFQRKALAGGRRAAAAPARPALVVCSLTEESAAVATGPSRLGTSKGPALAKGAEGRKGAVLAKGATIAKGTAIAKGPAVAKGSSGGRSSGSGGSSRGGQGKGRVR
jgi:hypothetical protein